MRSDVCCLDSVLDCQNCVFVLASIQEENAEVTEESSLVQPSKNLGKLPDFVLVGIYHSRLVVYPYYVSTTPQPRDETMTRIQKQLKTLAANKNNKIAQALLGKIRNEIQGWSVSIEAKRSAYRQALRVSGQTDQEHIEILADAFIR